MATGKEAESYAKLCLQLPSESKALAKAYQSSYINACLLIEKGLKTELPSFAEVKRVLQD